jgi:type IV pilus assembly protein PilC
VILSFFIMPTFSYKAVKKNGEEYVGNLDAEDRFAVYAHVSGEGGTVLSYKEVSRVKLSLKHVNSLIGSVKTKDIIVFARNLSTMIGAGLSLVRALAIVERQTTNAKLRSTAQALRVSVEGGKQFNEALAEQPKIFSSLMISMARAGEESGKLAETLKLVALQMERVYELKRRIRGALIYPAIIMTALVIIGVLMLVFVVPTLESTFIQLGVDLPAATRAIIATSSFISNNILLVLAMVIAFISALIFGMRTTAGKLLLDLLIINTPLIKTLAFEANSARTARTLSSLLSSGVSVVRAIEITADVMQNSYYKAILLKGREDIQGGAPISDMFSSNEKLYPPLVGELVSVGEETGQLPGMLLYVAEFYEAEMEQKTRNLSTVIEPFLMLLVGVVVGFFAVSMITPIYSVVDTI